MYTLRHAFFIVLSIILGIVRAPALVYSLISGGIVFSVTWVLRLPYFALGFIAYKFRNAGNLFLLAVLGIFIYNAWTFTEQIVDKYVGNNSYFITLPALPSMSPDMHSPSIDSSVRNIFRSLTPGVLVGPYKRVKASESPVGAIRQLLGFNHKFLIDKKLKPDPTERAYEKWRKNVLKDKSFWFVIWLFFLASDLSIPFFYLIHSMVRNVDGI